MKEQHKVWLSAAILTTAIIFQLALSSYANATEIKTCFTPGQRCDIEIIKEINNENKTILVQAYQLTNKNIAYALVNAATRGANVKIILDKSQNNKKRFSSAKFFAFYHVPVWIDYKPAIAHNKVIILGSGEVITGSYNFTNAAQSRNAENAIFIKDAETVKSYTNNFYSRLNKSITAEDYKKR